MTIRYQRSTAPGDWGTLNIAHYVVPLRLAILVAGVVLWLGTMVVATGNGGVTALWTNLIYLVSLLVLTILTRSISLWTFAWLAVTGGLVMAVMLIVSY